MGGGFEVESELRNILPLWLGTLFATCFTYILVYIGIAVEVKSYISIYGAVSGVVLRIGLGYVFCILWKWRIFGVFLARNVEMYSRMLAYIGFIFTKKLEDISGVQ